MNRITNIGNRRIVIRRIGVRYVVGVAQGSAPARAVLVTASQERAEALFRALVQTARRVEASVQQEAALPQAWFDLSEANENE